MKTMKKVLCMVLAFAMVLGLLPGTVLATGTEENVVYISVSFDGEYIEDINSDLILNVPVSLDDVAAVNLDEYGLGNMWYDAADPDGDGNYAPTALQLIIYAHENLYGGNWSDVSFSAEPGSSYFSGGVFGFTANLIYFLNGKFAVDEAMSEGSNLNNVLATSDHIILEAGDRLQMSSFSCWSFYTDKAGGLDSYADDEGNFVYEYAANTAEPLSVNMKQYFCDLMTGDWWVDPLANTEVFYGASYGAVTGSFMINEDGKGSVTFNEPGTYYLWTEAREGGSEGHDWCDAAMMGEACVVSTPAIAKVTVTGEATGGDSGSGDSGDTPDVPNETATTIKVTADEGAQIKKLSVSFCNDCFTTLYSTKNVNEATAEITEWACENHGSDTDNPYYQHNLVLRAITLEGYVLTGFSVNGQVFTLDPNNEAVDRVDITDLSGWTGFATENSSDNTLSLENKEKSNPENMEIRILAEKVKTEESDPTPDEAQDVSAVLNATMAQLASTVTAPAFGTSAGEWTVFGLARGGYYAKDNAYFTDYYDRIVATVNEMAASANMNGALDKDKSTENSRLIMALAAIGKDATSVGNWDLVAPYSANGMQWIAKQGFNGPIWALIALDSNDYETADPELRDTLVSYILEKQHDDGGWSLYLQTDRASNVDITGMTLTALAPYKDQPEVAAACAEAIEWLSAAQQNTGDFAYDESAAGTVESCAWAIVGLTEWGINPDTDSRFVKNGNSAVDALLSYYLEDKAVFEHAHNDGGNAMGTDQATYALVAYDRLINGKTALFDYSDVTFDAVTPSTDEMTATLGLPAKINGGDSFNGVISINKWDNEAGYKLIDMIVNVPEGVSVTDVTAGSRLSGGELTWNLEEDTGKLRVVYFDANDNADLVISGEEFPAELFNVAFKAENVTGGSKLDIAISGMSVKLTSDSSADESMVVVNTDTAKDTVDVVVGVSFSAKCLYTGDDVDIIPSTKKAVAVFVTGITDGSELTFADGETEIVFQYSAEISAKTNVSSYVALVDAEIEMEKFVDAKNFTIGAVSEEDAITFGDVNGDGVVNAQDALAAVDTWLRKGEQPTDLQILTMNVNGDSRINTYDALGIVEAFVNKTDYIVVTKAATITENQ